MWKIEENVCACNKKGKSCFNKFARTCVLNKILLTYGL